MAHPIPEIRTKTANIETKLRHRHSGSASNISLTSEEVGSLRSGGTAGSASFIEKRMKRRTRSSLGGTENLIEELDFLTPSPLKKVSDGSIPKEVPNSQDAERKTSSAVEVQTRVLQIQAKENGSLLNGGTHGTQKLISSDEESIPSVASGHRAEAKNMSESVGPPKAENSMIDNRETGGETENDGKHIESPSQLQQAGQAPVTAVPTYLQGVEGSDQNDHMNAYLHIGQNSASILEIGQAPEPPGSSSILPKVDKKSAHPEILPPKADDSTMTPPKRVFRIPPLSRPVSKVGQQDKQRRAEREVSVQKRIEELEEKAGGHPMHFRSRSLNLIRFRNVSHAYHHEAEKASGLTLPPYQSPRYVSNGDELENSLSEKNRSFLHHSSQVPEGEIKILAGNTLGPLLGGNSDGFSRAQTKGQGANREQKLDSVKPEQVGDFEFLLEEFDTGSIFHDSKVGEENIRVDEVYPTEEEMIVERFLLASNGNGAFSGEDLKIKDLDFRHRIEDSENLMKVEESEMPTASQTGIATEKQYLAERTHKDEHLRVKMESSQTVNGEGEASDEKVIISMATAPDEAKMAEALCIEAPTNQSTPEVGTEEFAGEGLSDGVPTVIHPAVELDGASKPTNEDLSAEAPEYAKVSTLANRAERSSWLAYGTIPRREIHSPVEPSLFYDENPFLMSKQLAGDPLSVEYQQDRLWEMHSQELSLRDVECCYQEVRESSAHYDDIRPFGNGTFRDFDVAADSSETSHGSSHSSKPSRTDRPHTPLRSLLAEEEAEEKGPMQASRPRSRSRSRTPPHAIVSPRGNLFRRFVSGGKASLSNHISPSKFSPRHQSSPKPFLSSCICCSPVK